MTKNPKFKTHPFPQKSPHFSQNNSPDSLLTKKPVWRFSQMDITGPWGWSNIDTTKTFLYILHEKLKCFETMTWEEIDRKGQNHVMPVSEVCSEAIKRLEEINLNDLDEIYSFRFTNRERLWGIRKFNAFYLLWWDPHHTVYPVYKKHT